MRKCRTMRWKRGTAFVLSLVLMLTMLPDVWTGAAVMAAQEEGGAAREGENPNPGGITLDGENIAWKATAGADYSNSGTDPKNVNNGYLATDSSTTWNSWKKEQTASHLGKWRPSLCTFIRLTDMTFP